MQPNNLNKPEKPENAGNVNCLHCKYFAVTWERKHPRACRLYGFKSSDMPSVTVYKSSGSFCTGFVKKEDKK